MPDSSVRDEPNHRSEIVEPGGGSRDWVPVRDMARAHEICGPRVTQ